MGFHIVLPMDKDVLLLALLLQLHIALFIAEEIDLLLCVAPVMGEILGIETRFEELLHPHGGLASRIEMLQQPAVQFQLVIYALEERDFGFLLLVMVGGPTVIIAIELVHPPIEQVLTGAATSLGIHIR